MLLYIIFFVTGSLAVDSLIPDLPSEPGMVSPELGLLIMGALNAILIIALLESSRYRGWKLAFGLAFAYYMKYLQVQKFPGTRRCLLYQNRSWLCSRKQRLGCRKLLPRH